MATENNQHFIPGRVAAADLSALQHRCMLIDSSGEVAQQTSGGGRVDGILQDKPDAQGKSASVVYAGTSKVEAGATVTQGAKVMTDTVGRAVDWTTTNHAFGVALDGGAVGEKIEVLLLPIGID